MNPETKEKLCEQAGLQDSPQESPKATPHFRVVFDPQSSDSFQTALRQAWSAQREVFSSIWNWWRGRRAASAFPDATRPNVGRDKQLSVTMLFVCLGISFAGWLVGMWIPFFLWIALISLILTIVSLAMLHYKCWKAVPGEFARLTPGKAVGYLFIPIFEFYWAFPSIAGLGSACTRLARSKGIEGFEHLERLGLTVAILNCLSIIGIFNSVLGSLAALGGLVAFVFFYRGVTTLLNGLAESDNT